MMIIGCDFHPRRNRSARSLHSEWSARPNRWGVGAESTHPVIQKQRTSSLVGQHKSNRNPFVIREKATAETSWP
jgi:hypothetical protein